MINALSAGISTKEPGVPAEVLCPYCSFSVTQYLQSGATLQNKYIKIEHREVSHSAMQCGGAAGDRLGYLSVLSIVLIFQLEIQDYALILVFINQTGHGQ